MISRFKNGRLTSRLARIYNLMRLKKIQNPLVWAVLGVLVFTGFGRGAERRFESLREKMRAEQKPNFVFILADDLGYGDLGCYGQTKIRTPNLDRMAAEGMRFTQFYTGCPVCAPSRCTLMTGKHLGHATVRDNMQRAPGMEGQHRMEPGTVTVAQLLKKVGYATAIVGKWGLGMP